MENDLNPKFKLGEQYENWEFELKAIPPYEIIENGLTLEVYEYIGKPISILQCAVGKVLLYFNADILHKVSYSFDISYKSQIKNRFFKDLPKNLKLKINQNTIEITNELQYI